VRTKPCLRGLVSRGEEQHALVSVDRRRVASLLFGDESQRAADVLDGVERVASERQDAREP
jgi:hypothetical protein